MTSSCSGLARLSSTLPRSFLARRPPVRFVSSEVSGQTLEKKWRLSASVVIVAPKDTVVGGEDARSDYRICMVKRTSRSSFMPDVMVFPGGAVDAADKRTCRELYGSDDVESVVKVAAARECLEEVGVVLPPKAGSPPRLTAAQLTHWRKAVHDDAAAFTAFCDSAVGASPDLDVMLPWCSFITPDMEHARQRKGGFDARFFLCCLPQSATENLKLAAQDNTETVSLIWISPHDALDLVERGKLIMAPPQWLILKELSHCTSMEDLPVAAASPVRTLSRDYPHKPFFIRPVPGECEGFSKCMALPGDEKHPLWSAGLGARNRIYMEGDFGAPMQYRLLRSADIKLAPFDAHNSPLGDYLARL